MKRYDPKTLEPKWQKIWEEQGAYVADLGSNKPKYMAMSMFNYPSGAGIHIGHAMNYTISDVKARFKRQSGYESYHPVGWDAFGLPAENYAIKAGVSPQASMATIIPSYHKQYKAMGWSNDWTKEIATHEPEYYRWTQWIFARMYKNSLAYQESRMQWWCEQCQTVLANEQIIDGKCWRHDGHDDPEVKQKEVKQWFFKITDYADELLQATDSLDWTESVKLAQKNWIGKSVGAEIDFKLENSDEVIKVYTTRPDTIFGATFLVLAPEHHLVDRITTDDKKAEVSNYINQTKLKSELERQASKEKTGVFTGAYAINPVDQQQIPVWIADYVLTGYGTGAIMAVPAHDERDYDFAKKYELEIKQTIAPYVLYTDKNAPRKGVETQKKPVVDAIIKNQNDEFLLLIEPDNIHFVGGGVEKTDENNFEAIKREVLEESGYDKVQSVRLVSSEIVAHGYRYTKNLNQFCKGSFYEVVVDSNSQVESEIEQGNHKIEWVKKAEVASRITWQAHLLAWQQYLQDSTQYDGEGLMINSGEYDGMTSQDAREKIVMDLAKKAVASEKTQYKIRDWSISRQRYWGAPIPIIHCSDDGPVLVSDEDLPVILPELTDFAPSGDGRSALARAKDWLAVDCPKCGKSAERETDTLDTYICSSWYMFRYLDPKNDQKIFDSNLVNKWTPIDFYNGGDHATAHLLYARFIGHFFNKIGLIDKPEPFKQMLFNGKIMASDGSAFSKSKGNGVDPLEIINSGYGADALRTYLMFAAPLEFGARWDPQGVPGTYRFINRLWTIVQEYLETKPTTLNDKFVKKLKNTEAVMIKKVSEDLEANKYNTAISASMKCVNDLYKLKIEEFGKCQQWQKTLSSLVACVAPFAPHVADELWHDLGHETSIQADSWPTHDPKYLVNDSIIIVVQVNGKLRASIEVLADASEENIINIAKSDQRIVSYIDPGVKKTVYIAGKLINFVV